MNKAIGILKTLKSRAECYLKFQDFAPKIDEAIKELEELMKSKSCDGCKHQDTCDILHSLYLDMLKIKGYAMEKNEFYCNKHEPKEPK